MSQDAKNPVPKIRTFAGDLKAEREHRDEHQAEPEMKVPGEPKAVPKPEKPLAKAPPQFMKPVKEPRSRIIEKPVKEEKPAAAEVKKVPITKVPKPKITVQKEPDPKPEKVVKPAKIPAFHEIDKQVKAMDDDAKSGKKVNVGFDAKIITDNRKSKPKFIPSVIAGIKEWFKGLKRAKKKSKNTYTIPETSRRKGVIQKATSKTGSVFTADNDQLKEQIRRRQQQQTTANEKSEESPVEELDTSWSPYTETGYDLLEAHNKPVQNVQVEYKKKAVPEPAPVEDTRWENNTVEEHPAPAPVPPTPPTPEPVATVEPTPPPVTEEPVAPVKPAPQPAPEPEPEPIEDTKTPEEPTDQPVDKSDMDTNTISVIVLLSIILLFIVVIVSRVLFQYVASNLNQPDETPTNTPTALLSNTSLNTITLDTSSNNQLPALIDNVVEIANGNTTEIVVVTRDGEEFGPSYIFNLLDLQTLPAFNQSLTALRFITAGSGNESMLLKFTDETTVRGGMLLWESTMASDLDALFDLGEGVIGSSFVDRTLADYDTRVLLNTAGEVILLYAILDENTALISTDTSDFVQIAEFGLKAN